MESLNSSIASLVSFFAVPIIPPITNAPSIPNDPAPARASSTHNIYVSARSITLRPFCLSSSLTSAFSKILLNKSRVSRHELRFSLFAYSSRSHASGLYSVTCYCISLSFSFCCFCWHFTDS